MTNNSFDVMWEVLGLWWEEAETITADNLPRKGDFLIFHKLIDVYEISVVPMDWIDRPYPTPSENVRMKRNT